MSEIIKLKISSEKWSEIWCQMTDADKLRWDEFCAAQLKGAKQKPFSISSGGHEYQIVQDSAWTLRNVAGWTGGVALFACSGPILGAISTLITVAALGKVADNALKGVERIIDRDHNR